MHLACYLPTHALIAYIFLFSRSLSLMVFIDIMPALKSDLILFDFDWFLHWVAVPILGLSALRSFFL